MYDTVHKLQVWFADHQRAMPWRQTRDPYAIWVSETMLQQTRVETVIPYYHAFLKAFPTVARLAEAAQEDVLKLWQGLGYYTRARNLHAAAKQLMELYGGRFPAEPAAFRRLPGVGPYTAGAVYSIAFGQPIPAVDGNVLRVMSRYKGIASPIDAAATVRLITDEVALWLQHGDPATVTQALMEVGATVCMPRAPRCADCPLQATCVARSEQSVERLPVRRIKPERRHVDVVAFWLEDREHVWMERRGPQGLLANLWQLPAFEVPRSDDTAPDPAEVLAAQLAADEPRQAAEPRVLDFALLAQERHVFTHLEWHVRVYRPMPYAQLPWRQLAARATAVRKERLLDLPLPRVYEKLVQRILHPATKEDEPWKRTR